MRKSQAHRSTIFGTTSAVSHFLSGLSKVSDVHACSTSVHCHEQSITVDEQRSNAVIFPRYVKEELEVKKSVLRYYTGTQLAEDEASEHAQPENFRLCAFLKFVQSCSFCVAAQSHGSHYIKMHTATLLGSSRVVDVCRSSFDVACHTICHCISQ